MTILLMILLFLTSLFLILLVLVQRGRGGGLAGAFGGMGGQSAFGTKAGDLFTRITIVVAAFWILLCIVSVKLLNEGSRSILSPNLGPSSSSSAPGTGNAAPKGCRLDAVPRKAPTSETPAAAGASPAAPPSAAAGHRTRRPAPPAPSRQSPETSK